MNTAPPKIGDRVTFYPPHHPPESPKPAPVSGVVVHVWGASCVNLNLNDGQKPTSVFFRLADDPAQRPAGYYCEPESTAAPASEQALEAEIVAKGKTAARVTPADVDAAIASEHYFTAADGVAAGIVAGYKYPGPLDMLTFCVLVLANGFTVTGESACASPENFDAEIGRKIARENARAKIWPLLGFRLRDRLAAA